MPAPMRKTTAMHTASVGLVENTMPEPCLCGLLDCPLCHAQGNPHEGLILDMRVRMTCENFERGGEDRYGELKRRIQALLAEWNAEHGLNNRALVEDY